jgi:hypothetical protein
MLSAEGSGRNASGLTVQLLEYEIGFGQDQTL